MQFIVVDIECFQQDVIKELAIASPFFCLGFSFAPSYPLTSLPLDIQRTNKWITTNLHGIPWESGFLPESSIEDLAAIFNNKSLKIFVKGSAKIKTLKKYFSDVNFTDLDTIHCPKFGELVLFPRFTDIICTSFPKTHCNPKFHHHCAQRKASMYCQWVIMFMTFRGF